MGKVGRRWAHVTWTVLLACSDSEADPGALEEAVPDWDGGVEAPDIGAGRDTGVRSWPSHCVRALGVECEEIEVAYFKPNIPSPEARFGGTVAFERDVIAIGAPEAGDPAFPYMDRGLVFIFERRSEEEWEWTSTLRPGPELSDFHLRFGAALALDGDTLVVGVPLHGSIGLTFNSPAYGTAVVYRRMAAGDWQEVQTLQASTGAYFAGFGGALALEGNTLVVGAQGDVEEGYRDGPGVAYVFRRWTKAEAWEETAQLRPFNGERGDRFGAALALEGDSLVVSSPGEDSAATGINGGGWDDDARQSGAAYVFHRETTGEWRATHFIKASNTDPGDRFGTSLALDSGLLVVGATGESSAGVGVDGAQRNEQARGSGAVYVFERRAHRDWEQVAYIKASNTDADDGFGASVHLQDELMAVGAPGEASLGRGVNDLQGDDSGVQAGAVYLFSRVDGGTWFQQAYLKASNSAGFDQFGRSVALEGDHLLVGAVGEDGSARGVNGNRFDDASENSGAAFLHRIRPR
ncbi:MAG: hypothetical protein AAF627_09140 [Myxococcota bacterium]